MLNKSQLYEQPSIQSVHIRQSNPIIQLNLPQLQENYLNIGASNTEDCMYQISYYDFPNTDTLTVAGQPNIILEIPIRLYILPIVAGSNPYNLKPLYGSDKMLYDINMADAYIDLVILYHNDIGITEVCSQINQQLMSATQVHIHTADIQKDYIIQQFLLAFKGIDYDPVMSRIVFSLESQVQYFDFSQQRQIYDNGVSLSFQSAALHQLIGFNLIICPLNQKTKYINQLLMSYLGGHSSANENLMLNIILTPGLEPTKLLYYSHFICNTYQSILNYYSPFATQATRLQKKITSQQTNPNDYFYSQYSTKIFVYSKYPCKQCIDNYVYIRSNANSNIWNELGVRSDIIEILPRNQTSDMTTSQYSNSLNQNQGSWIKTKLSALRQMQIRITDKEGNNVMFSRDFLLKINLVIL